MAFVLGPPPDPKTGFESYSWQTWFYQLWNSLKNLLNSFVGATALLPGSGGTVPAPAAGQNFSILQGNGAWGPKLLTLQVVTNGSGQFSVSLVGSVTFTFVPFVSGYTATPVGNPATNQYYVAITSTSTSVITGNVASNNGSFIGGQAVTLLIIGS